MTTTEPDDPGEHDATDQLAHRLGITPRDFAGAFGAHWHESPEPPGHDFDADPSGGTGHDVTPWHLGGSPPHLMARVFGHGVFLAVPVGTWEGVVELVHRPAHEVYLPVEQIGTDEGDTVVRALLRRRRSGFRYCRFCREPTPAELRVGDHCMGCATKWDHLVF